ncbi:hypothetical protein AB7Z61_20300 [Providencia rettgeri]
MKYLSVLMVLILGGCANVGPGKPMPVTPLSAPAQQKAPSKEVTTDPVTELDALQVLLLCFNKCGHFDKGIYSPLK